MIKRLELSRCDLPVERSVGLGGQRKEVWFLDLIERSTVTGFQVASNIANGTKDYCLGQKDSFMKANPGTLYRTVEVTNA